MKPAETDDLPDLRRKDVKDAAVKIQAVYRGFQTRKKVKKYSAVDVVFAAMTIQRVFRKYIARKRQEKLEEGLPDLKSADVAMAAVKIQKVYRGFQTRKQQKEELPDLRAPEVAMAAVKIQKVYRGFQARQKVQMLKDPAVAVAAVRIQSVYKGFKTRKAMKPAETEDLPDLRRKDVKQAAVKIQAVYRGFQTRKQIKEDLPDLRAPEVAMAAVKIQKVYRGFQARKKVEVLKDPEMAKAAVKIQAVYKGFKSRKEKVCEKLIAPKKNIKLCILQTLGVSIHCRRDFPLQNISLKCILLQAQEEEAAKKIQSVFKGFNVRKKQLQPAVTITLTSPDDDHWYGYDEDEYYNQPQEDMPDLNCPDVARAVVQIQKAYRGFQVCQSDYLA